MKKIHMQGISILLILLAIFSLIAFVIPTERTGVFWLAFVFGILAILIQGIVFPSALGGKSAKSRFYGLPLARVGLCYLGIQLVLSLAEILMASILPVWAAVVLNAVVLAAALLGLITTGIVRDELARQDVDTARKTSVMRELQTISAALAEQCQDSALRNRLKKLAEEFRYSDPVSSRHSEESEQAMMSMLTDLQMLVKKHEHDKAAVACDRLLGELTKRNWNVRNEKGAQEG